jgi:hypothetical protein
MEAAESAPVPGSVEWTEAQLAEPFEQMVDRALTSPEIEQVLSDPALSKDDLRSELIRRKEELLLDATAELSELASVDAQLKAAQERLEQLESSSVGPPSSGTLFLHGFFSIVSAMRNLARFILRRTKPSEDVAASKETWSQVKGPAGLQTDPQAQREELNIESIAGQVEVLQRRYTEAVFERGILRLLRTRIDEQTVSSYTTLLTLHTSAPGLAELARDDLAVSTSATLALQRLLQSVNGGSIGISGPRGVGKTTLIRAFHLGKYPIRPNTSRPQLSVMVSAPVVYQGREFVLHLFGELCRAVLGPAASGTSPVSSKSEAERRVTARAMSWFAVRVLPVAGLIAGIGLVLVASVVPDDRADRLVPAVVLLAVGCGAFVGLIALPLPRLAIFAALLPLTLAALLAGASWLALALIDKRLNELVLWGTALGFAGMAIYGAVVRAAGVSRRLLYEEQMSAMALDQTDPLVPTAREWLDRIRFQQTFTTGWSGGLKLPVGLEGGLSASTEISEQQMTFPDVVEALKGFLRKAGPDRDVLVAIDELDKMESEETANRFLNEIKAIFGIEHCFYLVSVSEDAMSAFERRGLPLRDIFDSSFDEILYMRYLPLKESREVLRERVIGLAVPFLFLSHCMSGGLPRDLIRVTRTLIDLKAQRKDALPLSDAASSLIELELSRKVRAVTVAARASSLEPHASNFLRWAEEVPEVGPNPAMLLKRCRDLDAFVAQDLPPIRDDLGGREERSRERERLVELCLELAVVAYFGASVLEYFQDGLTAAELRRAEVDPSGRSTIEIFAKARQAFATNKRVAWSLISEFRDSADVGPALDTPYFAPK